jgi:hypothetical protein
MKDHAVSLDDDMNVLVAEDLLKSKPGKQRQ